MTLTTYPLDNITYTADDAALFHATRTSGVYAQDSFTYSVTGADNKVTLGPGISWMRVSRFKGLVAALKVETAVEVGLPDAVYPRIDHIILQYNANSNAVETVIKSGTAASSPQHPERSMSEALYELHLLSIRREPGAVAISAADITDLRLDASWCGLMADSVTSIDTTGINAQFQTLLALIQDELAALEAGTAVELKKLQFTDTAVAASAFVADTTWPDNYPYRAAVALEGVLASMIPEVIFAVPQAASGIFAATADSYNGGIYLYAADVPEANFTIPTILLWRGNA